MRCQVLYAPLFHEQLMALPDRVYERVEHSIDLLASQPGLARDYDPQYDADMPPIDCKWHYVPRTSKVIYFTYDEQEGVIRCFRLGDTREDPMQRFIGL